MKARSRFTKSPLAVAVMVSLVTMAPLSGALSKSPSMSSSQAVLIAAKNPCAANPCAAKNPCGARNPCGANPCAAKNPCAARNPCGANPCAARNPCAGRAQLDPKLITRPRGTRLTGSSRSKLLRNGERLWSDTSLGTNGLACASCHQGNKMFQATFTKPYPHKVAMPAAMAGKSTIALDEMVQICLIVPMAGKPLPWQSHELAALTAYTAEVQKRYVTYLRKNPCAAKVVANPCGANPCAAKNPCAGRNPCAAKNPCGANPCAAKNPCAAHPCAAKNPCGAGNPCAAKGKRM